VAPRYERFQLTSAAVKWRYPELSCTRTVVKAPKSSHCCSYSVLSVTGIKSRSRALLLSRSRENLAMSQVLRLCLQADHKWRNDGVAAASRDGGSQLARGPRQLQVLND